MAQQEMNSTKNGSGDDAGGVVILALVAGIGLIAWLGTRRPWLYEQGVLESPDEWWPLTFLGWLVAIGLVLTVLGLIVSVIAAVSEASARKQPDLTTAVPVTMRSTVLTVGAAAVTVLLVLGESLGWALAVLAIVAVAAVIAWLVYMLAVPARKTRLVVGTAKYLHDKAGYSGSGHMTTFVKAKDWTSDRKAPVPRKLIVHVGKNFSYNGGQSSLVASEASEYVSDLCGMSVTYNVEELSRSRQQLVLIGG